MAADGTGTARHWIVSIIAAAIVLAGLLIFGGREPGPPAATTAGQQTQSN